MLASLNLILRFLLEVAGVASVALWGVHAGRSRWSSVALGVGLPLLVVLVWSRVVAPGADNPLAPDVRVLIGSAILLLASLGLAATGRGGAAVAFAVLIAVNTAALLVLEA